MPTKQQRDEALALGHLMGLPVKMEAVPSSGGKGHYFAVTLGSPEHRYDPHHNPSQAASLLLWATSQDVSIKPLPHSYLISKGKNAAAFARTTKNYEADLTSAIHRVLIELSDED